MAFQPVNFAGIAPQGNPALRNLVSSLVSGYQAARLPTQISQQEKARELANQFTELQVGYEPKRQQLEEALTRAKTEKALRPAQPVMSNFEKVLNGLPRIKAQYGENSQEYQWAKDYIQRFSQGTGTQLTVDPNTGAVTFSQGSGSRNAPAMQIVDGKIVQAPTTPTRTAQQKGSLANVIREETAKFSSHPYVGTGSNASLLKDRFLYGRTKDPKKKKEIGDRLVAAAAAMRLVPEYALVQLQAQGAQATVPAIEHQSQAIMQGWAEGLPQIVNNLPKELQEEAKQRHDEAIESLNGVRNNFIAQGLPIELSTQNKEKVQQSKTIGGKTYVQINGKWYEK